MADPEIVHALLHATGEMVDHAPSEVENVPDDSFTEFFRFFWRIPKLALKFLATSLFLCPFLLYISMFAQGTGTGDIEPAAKIAELQDLRWADLLLPTFCGFHWFYFRSRRENQTDIGKWKTRMYGRWIALALVAGAAVALASVLREQSILQTQK
ncbi:MAG: hypothetical protein WCK51_08725 [Armatimonadota bacterium]